MNAGILALIGFYLIINLYFYIYLSKSGFDINSFSPEFWIILNAIILTSGAVGIFISVFIVLFKTSV